MGIYIEMENERMISTVRACGDASSEVCCLLQLLHSPLHDLQTSDSLLNGCFHVNIFILSGTFFLLYISLVRQCIHCE